MERIYRAFLFPLIRLRSIPDPLPTASINPSHRSVHETIAYGRQDGSSRDASENLIKRTV
jgi:hypothetical protein